MKSFLSGKIYLTIVIIQKIQKIFEETNKKVIGKMKDEFDGVIVDDFDGLKSEMYLRKKAGGKECNTAKEVSAATELNKFKDVLYSQNAAIFKIRGITRTLPNINDEAFCENS